MHERVFIYNEREYLQAAKPYCHPMQLHFCRVAVFCCSCIVSSVMIYRAFGSIYSYAFHYLREDKLFSSRGYTFLLARINYSLREEKNFFMVSILKINILPYSFYYY